MLNLGAIAFANPFLLTALISLPAIWLLIRALPPVPKRFRFPPLALLKNIGETEPPPIKTPLWILILRLLLAALIILALAEPLLNPEGRFAGTGPVMIVVDNGWEAASRWPDRISTLKTLLEKAQREDRPVILLPTAAPAGGLADTQQNRLPDPLSADKVKDNLEGLGPLPYSPDYEMTARRANGADIDGGPVIWLSDGIAHVGVTAFHQVLAMLGDVDIRSDANTKHPLVLLPVEQSGLDFLITIRRPARPYEQTVTIRALAADGRRLGEIPARFEAGSDAARARFSLPGEIRNAVARIEIAEEHSAGAVILIDSRSSRPSIGLLEGEGETGVQPLRSARYFLKRAVEPFSDLREGQPDDLIGSGVSILMLADVGQLSPPVEQSVGDWVRSGGILVRFAGPRMASGTDSLVPVRLRLGDRSFGGALSWEEPQRLGPMPDASPFAGLSIPDDVVVERQILAAPVPDLAEKAWARLQDGTPIVTAARDGEGWLILFHTTGNTDWSNLAVSGLFVEMLQRIFPFARSADLALTDSRSRLLAPYQSLDGRGALRDAYDNITAIPSLRFEEMAAGPMAPPGLYGDAGSPLALNLASSVGPIDGNFTLKDFDEDGVAALRRGWQSAAEIDLKPPFLLIAVILAIVDVMASLFIRGLMARPRFAAKIPTAALAFLILFSANDQTFAQQVNDEFALDVTRETRIAYVLTGNPVTDRMSEAGLTTLGFILRFRTAVNLGPPVGVNPESDTLNLFPLIYWPVPSNAEPLSPETLAALNRYLRTGGMVLFDTGIGDPAGLTLGLSNPQSEEALRRLLQGLDAPPLVPADRDHVLGKSFYLLDQFPGRISGRPLWVEEASTGDDGQVSGLLIGSHDWASAWAADQNGIPLVPSLAGGNRQREYAYRFGVNLVMYALTGTYKADQLHLPEILRRLGE